MHTKKEETVEYVSDERVQAVSEKLIRINKEAYEELAK